MALSHGIDLAPIARIRELSRDELFLKRVFTEKELEYAFSKKDPYKHLAGRFAVKEAVMKALQTGWAKGVGWKDVEVLNTAGYKPELKLTNEAGNILAGRTIRFSIAYSSKYAVAVAVIEG